MLSKRNSNLVIPAGMIGFIGVAVMSWSFPIGLFGYALLADASPGRNLSSPLTPHLTDQDGAVLGACVSPDHVRAGGVPQDVRAVLDGFHVADHPNEAL